MRVEDVSRRSESFFLSVVEQTVREYLDNIGDVRRGRLAAIVLNHLADYWAADENIESPSALRARLQLECPLFSVIRDLSDASKHVKISRQNRVLSDEGQLSRPPPARHA